MKKLIKILLYDDKLSFYGILILSILCGLFPAVYVVIYSSFIDAMIQALRNEIVVTEIYGKIIMVIGFTMFQYFLNSTYTFLIARFETIIERTEQEKLLEKVARIRFIDMENSSVYGTINHVEKGIPKRLIDGYTSILGCIQLGITIIGISSVLIRYSVGVSIIVFVSFIPVVIISIKSGKEDYSDLETYFEIERRTDSLEKIITSPAGNVERWVFSFHDWVREKWMKKYDEGAKVFYEYKKKSYFRVKKMSLAVKIICWLLVGVLIYNTASGRFSIGILVVLIQQIFEMCNRVTWDMYANLYNISVTKEFINKYEECYSIQELDAIGEEIADANEIVFDKVSFRYSEDSPYVLKDLDLSLKKGHSYAIVGENGAGKSTLLKIILGIYREYEGNIYIDGVEAREIIGRKSFICPVFQDFARYELSIRENVGLTEKDKISDEEIDTWAKKLNLDLSKKNLASGYDEPVGKLDGKNIEFSGGEWQKIALMRALASKKEWITLDEPTSALDPMTEMRLYEMFYRIMENRSAILVTHRLGAARMVDTILVLHHGRIVEGGSHEELIEQNGIYKEMFVSQKGWYQDEE